MPEYINLPLKTDPDDIIKEAFDFVKSKYPDWEPHDGNPGVVILSALAYRAAENADVASRAARSIFRWYGANVLQLPPNDAVAASGTVVITVSDLDGHTIEAGHQVFGLDNNGDPVFFELADDLVIAAGNLNGSTEVIAVEEGEEPNELSGNVTLTPSLAYVSSAVFSAPAGGGREAETDDAYLVRLIRRLGMTGPRPVRASDYANFALDFPEVFRCIGIDNFVPAGSVLGNTADLFNQERAVVIVALREDGLGVSSQTKLLLANYFETIRLLNFIVSVVDGTYTTIHVSTAFTTHPDYSFTEVRARVEAALRDYLNPRTWGSPSYGDASSNTDYEIQREIDKYELSYVINSIEGVDKIRSVTYGDTAQLTTGFVDAPYLLPGAVPIPVAGTIVCELATS